MEADFAKQLEKYAAVSGALTHGDVQRIGLLAEVGQQYQRILVRKAAHAAKGAPMLMSYSADGTPALLKHQVKQQSPSGSSVLRSGRASHELLVQTLFCRRVDGTGKVHTVALLHAPVPLTNGKTAMAQYAVGREFIPDLRREGHRGIQICHFAFDRACYSALARLWRQHHQASTAEGGSNEGGDPLASPVLLDLLTWVVATPCAVHDTHNGLKWSLFFYCQQTDVLKDVFVVIESLRNCLDLLHGYLGAWLAEHLHFVEEEELDSVDSLQDLWLALGVAPPVVEVLAEELRLRWRDGRLEVAAPCRGTEDLVGKVSFALLSLWRFEKFSESRWVTVGASCRSLVAGLLTGLPSLIATIRQDPKASDFHLHGVERLTAAAKQFIVRAAISSHVSDAGLRALMEDSRVAMRLPALKECVQEEMQWLADVGGSVWTALAGASGEAASVVRSDTVASGHVSLAFLHSRYLLAAQQLPWSLASGDPAANLEKLKNMPQPTEPTAAKIWTLLQLGYNRQQLLTGLQLLLDCPWGTVAVEQQHASAAIIKRFHQEYGLETLLPRSLVHGMRKLLPKPSAAEKTIAALRAKIRRLKAKRPSGFGARQLYVKDLMGLAAEWDKTGERRVPAGVRKTIVKQHSASFERMPAEMRRQYVARASAASSSSQQSVEDELEHTRARLQLAADRASAEEAISPPLSLSASQWDADDLAALTTLLQAAAAGSQARVAELWRKAVVAPPLPSAADRQALQAQPLSEEPPPGPKPAWLSTMCWQREYFANVALLFSTESGKKAYKFLFATKSPQEVWCAPLAGDEQWVAPVVVGPDNWEDLALEHRSHTFQISFSEFCASSDLPSVGLGCLEVLPDLQYQGGRLVVSDSDPVPWQVFVDMLPPIKRGGASSAASPGRPAAGESPQDLVAKYPWLARHLSSSDTAPGSSSAQPTQGTPEEPEEQVDLTDEALEEMFAELQRRRQQWEADADTAAQDFQVTLSGSAWVQRNRGIPYDSFLGSCKGADAKAWCQMYSLPLSNRFDIELYGEADANLLATTWCSAMQYYYNLSVESGPGAYLYTERDLQGWPEPREFSAMVARASGRKLQRAVGLRRLVPTNP